MNSSLKNEGSESGRDSGAEPSGYDALLLDLDGTALDPAGKVRESTRRAVRALDDSGVRVMITTGRSATASVRSAKTYGRPETASVRRASTGTTPRSLESVPTEISRVP